MTLTCSEAKLCNITEHTHHDQTYQCTECAKARALLETSCLRKWQLGGRCSPLDRTVALRGGYRWGMRQHGVDTEHGQNERSMKEMMRRHINANGEHGVDTDQQTAASDGTARAPHILCRGSQRRMVGRGKDQGADLRTAGQTSPRGQRPRYSRDCDVQRSPSGFRTGGREGIQSGRNGASHFTNIFPDAVQTCERGQRPKGLALSSGEWLWRTMRSMQ